MDTVFHYLEQGFNGRYPDFVIYAGDLVDAGRDRDDDGIVDLSTYAQYDSLESYLRRMDCPSYLCFGNHDNKINRKQEGFFYLPLIAESGSAGADIVYSNWRESDYTSWTFYKRTGPSVSSAGYSSKASNTITLDASLSFAAGDSFFLHGRFEELNRDHSDSNFVAAWDYFSSSRQFADGDSSQPGGYLQKVSYGSNQFWTRGWVDLPGWIDPDDQYAIVIHPHISNVADDPDPFIARTHDGVNDADPA
jgi:hypothetical protein